MLSRSSWGALYSLNVSQWSSGPHSLSHTLKLLGRNLRPGPGPDLGHAAALAALCAVSADHTRSKPASVSLTQDALCRCCPWRLWSVQYSTGEPPRAVADCSRAGCTIRLQTGR